MVRYVNHSDEGSAFSTFYPGATEVERIPRVGDVEVSVRVKSGEVSVVWDRTQVPPDVRGVIEQRVHTLKESLRERLEWLAQAC